MKNIIIRLVSPFEEKQKAGLQKREFKKRERERERSLQYP